MASAAVRNVSQASGLLPFLLIPQFVFAGVLFEATGFARVLSWFAISRWAIGAYGALVDVNGMVLPPVPTFGGQVAPQPFAENAVYDATLGNLYQNWLGLELHAIAYLAIAFLLLARKDRR
ncbi:MAG: ABC transporter [Cyanobacteria bacterium J06639_1]